MNPLFAHILKKTGTTFTAVLFGVYFTHFSIEQGFLSPILSSSLCGLVASLAFVRKWNNLSYLGLAMYCGSFAGMGSVFETQELIITSILVTILILISAEIFKGYGGKLGFIAYLASAISEVIIIIIGQKPMANFSLLPFVISFYPLTNVSTVIGVFLASSFGFYVTIYLHHYVKKSSVFSSAFPSFIVGLIVFIFDLPNIDLMAVTFFSASFIGMLSEGLLQKKHFPFIVLIHILIILLFKYNFGVYGGVLGTIAFFSVLVFVQVDVLLLKRLKKKLFLN